MPDGEYEPPTGLPTVFDPSYKGVGKQAGLTIWRVEKLAVSKKDRNEEKYTYAGQFHKGDSYIILYCKLRGNALEKHIHFWLGAETSQDEMGVAAYKTVELDEYLGGEAVQHRQVQGSETDEFKKIFPNLTYLEGGIATGFKHVDRDAYPTRLLHVKGRRNVVVEEIEVNPTKMNRGDVYIADTASGIVQWNGETSSNVEKIKAVQVCNDLRTTLHGGDAKISIVDQDQEGDGAFWDALGIKKAYVNPATSDDDDSKVPAKRFANLKLFKVSDDSGSTKMQEIAKAPLKQSQLDTNDAFIVDVSGTHIYVWIGKKASKTERLNAMRYAQDCIKKNGYKAGTPITRVVQFAEPPVFQQLFTDWIGVNETTVAVKKKQKSKSFIKRMFSAKEMHTVAPREEQMMVDDGQSGKLKVWRIENFELAEVDAKDYGTFYSGDSYVILYTYLEEGVDGGKSKEAYLIYFWQGSHSSQDERGSSALHAKDQDDKLGGEATQVRVTQGHEPRHFLQIFKGKFVVHAGGKGSGFKNRNEKDFYDTDGLRLFQIRGVNKWAIRAIQVPEKARSLNSGDAFFLESPKGNFMWVGALCNTEERLMAESLIPHITSKSYTRVEEGKEPGNFWEGIGGKEEYAKVKDTGVKYRDPRLFQASNNKGYFYVEEVFDFTQDDLLTDDVMILDTFKEVFVWIGKDANTEEKKSAMEAAIEFVKSDPTGRTEDNTAIIVVKQGSEPLTFRGQFPGWDPNRFGKAVSYEELKEKINSGTTDIQSALSVYEIKVYSYEVLTQKNLPEGVDPLKKEQYLSDDEFVKYVGMDKEAYSKVPAWKQRKIKMKANLF
eukprot:m.56380 g.56380  ORF g.56380 m.56380 type:complete len:830 (-) comp12608_c0_seq1:214-2703(-)